MTNSILWSEDTPVTEFDIDVPAWINQDITVVDVAAVCQSGCDSGAYMPAVTYHIANETMAAHGDDVMQYIKDAMGELPDVSGQSWSGLASRFLALAVELWCSGVEDELTSAIEEAQEVE